MTSPVEDGPSIRHADLTYIGGPSLRTASATADVFVLAIGAAKHAATQFIERHRPKESITLYARGKGSAGILRALGQHLQSAND